MGKGVWGIDISKYSCKAVRMEKSGDGSVITRSDVASFELEGTPEAEELDQLIRMTLEEMKSRLRIGREKVVLSLPGHSTFNRLIKLPPVEDSKIPEVVRYEAQSQIPFNIDEVIWDYQYVDRQYAPGEEKEVILFAVKKDVVEQFLQNIEPLGLNIEAIQFAPIALYNFLAHDQDIQSSAVVLDMGGENTDLLIIDGEKFWIRNLPITGNDITKALQKTFNIPFEEAEKLKLRAEKSPQAQKIFNAIQPVLRDLVGEVHRSIGYYKSISKSIRFDKIILLGNSTKTLNFQKFMSQSLQMPANKVERLNHIVVAPGVDAGEFNENLGTLGTAIGLAVQGLEESKNRVNLLPDPFRKKKELKKKQPFVVAIVGVLYALVITMWLLAGAEKDALAATQKRVKDVNALFDSQSQLHDDAQKIIEQIEKPLRDIASISYERDLVLKVVNAIYPNIPSNGDAAVKDTDKLWILEWAFEEALADGDGKPVEAAGVHGARVYAPHRLLRVTIDGAILTSGRSATEIAGFVRTALLGCNPEGQKLPNRSSVVDVLQLRKEQWSVAAGVTAVELLPDWVQRQTPKDSEEEARFTRFRVTLAIPMRPEVRKKKPAEGKPEGASKAPDSNSR